MIRNSIQSLSHAAHDSSLCTREPWRRRPFLSLSLLTIRSAEPPPPSLMVRGSDTPTHASPFGKGGDITQPHPMPPLLERGGVERSETEGIRKSVFDSSNWKRRINPQKGRHLLCSFCHYEMRSMSRKGRELCPIGAKREGKPRFSGACRAHAVVSPFNFSASHSLLLFCPAKEKQRNPALCLPFWKGEVSSGARRRG